MSVGKLGWGCIPNSTELGETKRREALRIVKGQYELNNLIWSCLSFVFNGMLVRVVDYKPLGEVVMLYLIGV